MKYDNVIERIKSGSVVVKALGSNEVVLQR
jgi:hypothetical protein